MVSMDQVLMVGLKFQVRDSKVKVKRRENLQKKDVPLTIEKKKRTEIICLQLIAKELNREVTQEVVQGLNIKISSQTSSNSNNLCLSSSTQQISTHLPKDNKIRTLDKMVFHSVTTALVVNKHHRYISLLKSSSSSLKFHQINS